MCLTGSRGIPVSSGSGRPVSSRTLGVCSREKMDAKGTWVYKWEGVSKGEGVEGEYLVSAG